MTTPETRLVQRPTVPGDGAHASSTPIYQTATFVQRDGAAWDYTRSGNPTRDVLEAQLAALDGANRAFAFSSGMSALSAALRLVASGERVVAGADLYGGTFRLLHAIASRSAVDVEWVDVRDADAVARALETRTRLVLVESLSNPHLRPADIPVLARLAHAAGALLAVDNSMLSPLCVRPLEDGADLAIQSATKLLCGHGDATAGVVATDDEEIAERLGFWQNAEGSGLAPFEAWLVLRGLETLAVRLERQQRSARRLGRWLRERGVVELFVAPERTPACVLSFRTGDAGSAEALLQATKLFRPAVSFGSVTSSISRPASMSHASIPPELRASHAPAEDLVRLSVGLESPADLEADLECALEDAVSPGSRRQGRGAAPERHRAPT